MMSNMLSRLFKKFALIYFIIITVSFIILNVLLEGQIRQGVTERITEELLNEGQVIASLPFENNIPSRLSEMTRDSKTRVAVINRNGKVIGDSSGERQALDNHLNKPEVQESRLKGQGISIRYSNSLKMDVLYVAFAVRDASQNIRGYIQLSHPLTEVRKVVDDFHRVLFIVIVFVFLLSGFLAYYFIIKIVRPIQEMASFTEGMIGGGPKIPLNINSRDEIGTLSKNIQQMATNLEKRINSKRRERQIVMSVFDTMAEGVVMLDAQNRVERANRSFLNLIGLSSDFVFQKSLLEIFRHAGLRDLLELSQKTGETTMGEIIVDGDTELEVNISEIVNLPMADKKTLLVFRDVSQLKKLERMRIDFVANVSHEIKTPLTTIIGFIETINKTPPDQQETTRQFLRIVHDNALRLNRMVNDLLTLSNIELGKTQLHLEEISLREMVEGILMMMENIAEEKELTLFMDIDENFPPFMADKDRLFQILINLLDNAVKATEAGGSISVSAKHEDKELVIKVMDTGIGITPKDIPRLGERFYRADKARSRKLGGTGLGLSIVKHLMEAHRGRIQIESGEGKGTTVFLYFPLPSDY